VFPICRSPDLYRLILPAHPLRVACALIMQMQTHAAKTRFLLRVLFPATYTVLIFTWLFGLRGSRYPLTQGSRIIMWHFTVLALFKLTFFPDSLPPPHPPLLPGLVFNACTHCEHDRTQSTPQAFDNLRDCLCPHFSALFFVKFQSAYVDFFFFSSPPPCLLLSHAAHRCLDCSQVLRLKRNPIREADSLSSLPPIPSGP